MCRTPVLFSLLYGLHGPSGCLVEHFSCITVVSQDAIDIIIMFVNEWSMACLKKCTDSYLMMALNKKIECSDVLLASLLQPLSLVGFWCLTSSLMDVDSVTQREVRHTFCSPCLF